LKNKFIKILKRTLITVGILFALAFITNEIVYRISIPDEFESANWSGKWNSSEYKLVGGKVLTSISTPIIENSKFKSPTLLYYNIWSLYKPGQIKVVEMNGTFGRENFGGNSELGNKNLQELEPLTTNFFKAEISLSNGQMIEYDGMKWKDDKKIFGDYVSKFPSDLGEFELSTE
jgi:hypothetical protein